MITKKIMHIVRSPSFRTFIALGFVSGLPFGFVNTTIQAWFTDSGVDIMTIGALSYVGMPWLLHFLWAPLMERYIPPFLGYRRGWIFLMQICLIFAILSLAFLTPEQHPVEIAFIAFLIALLSASQDICIDAFRVESFRGVAVNLAMAYHITGYRLAMVMPAVAMFVAAKLGWRQSMLLTALAVMWGLVTTYRAREPKVTHDPPKSLKEAVVGPWAEWTTRPSFIGFTLLLVFYKFGHAFSNSLVTTFLLREMEFSLTQVAIAHKAVGLFGTVIGVFAGGILSIRLGLYRALLTFGLLQTVSIFGMYLIASSEPSFALMAGVIFTENICVGMATAAVCTLILRLTHHQHTATQFAMLTALASVSVIVSGPFAAEMVENWGWPSFFLCSIGFCGPGIIMVILMRRELRVIMSGRRGEILIEELANI